MKQKSVHFLNGYSISLATFFNEDGEPLSAWCIWDSHGELYLRCCNYNEAYEIASHLVPECE